MREGRRFGGAQFRRNPLAGDPSGEGREAGKRQGRGEQDFHRGWPWLEPAGAAAPGPAGADGTVGPSRQTPFT